MASSKVAFSCSGCRLFRFVGERLVVMVHQPCMYSDLWYNVDVLTIYDVRILGKRAVCGHEDYALWLKILRDGHPIYIPHEESLALPANSWFRSSKTR
jgi:hypothetical protein